MRERRREAGEVGRGGAGEGVDGLARVPDHAHVVPACRPGVEQQFLERVDVLELIHHERPVPVGDLGRRDPVPGEDGRGEFQHGLEVDEVPFPAHLLVGRVQAGGGLRAQRRGPAGGSGGSGIVLRPHLADLGPFDLPRGVAQLRQARVHPELAGRLGEQSQLGIEHRRRPSPHGARPEVGELPQRRRMEGPGLDLFHPVGGPGQVAQPPPQLTGRSGGEGDGQHMTGVDHAGAHPVGDPVRDRPGLAGPGPGQHADGPPGGQRHLPLLRVERGEHGLRSISIQAAGIQAINAHAAGAGPPRPAARIRAICLHRASWPSPCHPSACHRRPREAGRRPRCCTSGTNVGVARRYRCQSRS